MNSAVKKFKTIDEISTESHIAKRLLVSSARKLDINPSIGISQVDAQMLIEATNKTIQKNTSFNHSTLP